MRTRTTRLAILLVAIGLLAAGCGGDHEVGGDEPAPAPAPAQTAAAESRPEGSVQGTGYVFVPPDGWRDVTDDLDESAIRIDRALTAPDREAGFRTNVSVIRDDVGAQPDELDHYAESLRGQVADLSATAAGVSEIEELTLDGVPARTWTYDVRRRQAPRVRQRQLVVIHDGAAYSLTWSAAAARFDAEGAALDALLASWRWS